MSTATARMYLHVGCRKTGTSFLQRVIYTDPDALSAQGLELPLKGRATHLRLLQALGVVTDTELPGEQVAAVLRRFRRRLSALGTADALISHEDLAAAEPDRARQLLELLEPCQTHVIVTARDLARQIPSEWQQCVKTRMELTFEEFVTAVVGVAGPDAALFWARQDVAGVADRWGASIPPERVHIVTVPPPGAPPDLLAERFWSVMGVDSSRFGQVDGGNPSLGAEQAELLRRVNVALGDRLSAVREEYRPVIRTFVAQVLMPQGGSQLRLPRRHAQWCRETSLALVERLYEGGYHVAGDLADLVPAEPGTEQHPNGPSIDDAGVAAAAVEALARVLEQQHRDRDRGPGQAILP